jgi:hypothetical protein
MQAFMRIRFTYFLLTVLILCASTPQATAGVQVAMADDLEKNHNFLVTTEIYYYKPEGFHVKKIDRSFLTAGRTRNVTVLAVWPLLYHHVSAYAIHPAYYTGSSKTDKTPFALRTVELPILQPPSWRYLLDSGAPLRENVVGITSSIVNDHFYVILHQYLPIFDRARIKEDLRQYLPLLHELAGFAHSEQAYKNAKATMVRISGTIQDKYVESLKMTVERCRGELDQRLKEIKAWLALEQSKRAPMHDWMDHFHKEDYVYRKMMNDSDHKRIEQWLEKSGVFPDELTLQWTNAETGVHYTLYLQSHFSWKLGSGWSTVLTVDLNPILGLRNNERYLKKSFPSFYRNAEGMWKLMEVEIEK